MLPIIYCQAIDFFDRLNELYIGQVLVVSRHSNEKKDIINELWIREGNTVYRTLDGSSITKTSIFDVSNMNGDENNVMV